MPDPDAHAIRSWQVLIAGAGTLGDTELYGRSILADGRLAGRFVGPHAMVLDFLEPGSDFSLFAYAVLATSVGLRAVRSTSFGTKILGLRKDLLRTLPIPQPTTALIIRVSELIRSAFNDRQLYATALADAREPLEALPEMKGAAELYSRRSGRCIAWSGPMPTLRAWNFASVGQALPYLRSQWKGCLRDLLTEPPTKGARWARIPCTAPYGVELMDQRDAASIRPNPRRIVRPAASPIALFPGEEELLVASRGQLSDGTLFGKVFPAVLSAGRMVSEDFVRLRPSQGWGEVVYAFLTTKIGHALVRSTAYGTSIPAVREDLLSALPFPLLDTDAQNAVSLAVREALARRLAAHNAEAEAIRIVEEEVLPQWLA